MSRHGLPNVERDVHTEHCCALHGCKYDQYRCTVVTRQKPQSWMCEWCYDWIEENWELILLMNELWDRGYAAGLSVVEVR
jgi:hypothetical protein